MNKLQALTTKEYYRGFFVRDYKRRFELEVSNLLSTVDEKGNPPSIEFRKKAISELFAAYVEQTGKTPDGVQVQRLGNWLLLEELTNNHPDKVTREEYPFLTKRQLHTRYNREMADENIPETHTVQKYLGGKKQSSYMKSE